MRNEVDIQENDILHLDKQLLKILLIDRSKPIGKDKYENIIWATDNEGFLETEQITIESITGKNGFVLKPRVAKTKEEQEVRVREKAEVFTPSWICNKQNNLIDNAWFGFEGSFNNETEFGWIVNTSKITFPIGKSWKDYVKDKRLEVSCGEAPYIVSRYDTIKGTTIPIQERIGILDRKLRVVSENASTDEEWVEWSLWAIKSIYGYEWQGDNLLLARENILYSYIDYYKNKFSSYPKKELLREVTTIISWNLWQMDGLKCVVPYSCKTKVKTEQSLFGDEEEVIEECEGCKKDDIRRHNGIYCKIKDWETGGVYKFISLIK